MRVSQVYAVAAGAIALALLARFALDSHLGNHLPYVTFFVAVAAVAWYSPFLGPSAFAAGLGLIASHWFFVPPRGDPFAMDVQHWVGLGTYLMVTGAFIGFGLALQASRRRAEENERHYRTLVAPVKDYAIFRTDAAGRPTTWNAGVKEILDYDESEFIGLDVNALFSLEDAAAGAPAAELRTAAEQGAAHGDCWLLRKDGVRILASGTTTALKNDSGEIVGFSKVFRDVTGLRDSEEMKNRLAAIVGSSDDAILSKDLNGIIMTWNRGAERIFGYTASETIGRPITMLMPPDRISEEHGILERIRRGERIDHYETVRRRKNGELFDISLTVSPIRDENGVIVGASKFARDITERKRLERLTKDLNAELERKVAERTAELKASTEELETFSYSVAHDLRAPLRSISGFAQLILRKAEALDSQSRDFLGRIVDSGVQMSRLIDGLLNLSRLSRKELRTASVDMTREALAIAEDLKKTQPERRIDFVIAPDLTAVGDPDLLKTALSNLLENAWKFTSKRPAARVEFGKTKDPGGHDRTVFFVRDDGAGFDMDYAQRLFGAFSRLHHASEFPGTGIGLATVQRILRRHGGEIWAESAPERGATFYFTVGAAGNGSAK